MIRQREINNLNKEEKWLKMKVAILLINLVMIIKLRFLRKKSNCIRNRLRRSI